MSPELMNGHNVVDIGIGRKLLDRINNPVERRNVCRCSIPTDAKLDLLFCDPLVAAETLLAADGNNRRATDGELGPSWDWLAGRGKRDLRPLYSNFAVERFGFHG